jgi:histone H3/H4
MKMPQVILPAFQGKSCFVKFCPIWWLIAFSDNTETLRDLGLDRGRISLDSARTSDIRPTAAPRDDTETFVFTVPPRDASELLDEEQADESVVRADDEVLYEASDEEILDEMDEDEVGNIGVQDLDATSSLQAADPETSLLDTTLHENDISSVAKPKAARKKRMKLSKHGIEYPSLPAGVVKKLATSYARMAGNSKAKISKDTLDVIMQASDWFFEQVSGDLGAYAKHAGRKTIDESDIVTLMGR